MPEIKGTTQQDYLLSVNMNANPFIENALPGVHAYPLMIDIEHGVFAIYIKMEPGTIMPKHFHSGPVHFYTLKGRWHYAEHPDDVQTAGSYLYEPGGSVHTLLVPEDAEECAEGFIINIGSNVEFDENDNFMRITDAGLVEQMAAFACQQQGRTVPPYIKVGGRADIAGG